MSLTHQFQLNKFTCVATSFAMAMGLPIKVLLDELGHDGMGDGPTGYGRGHHPQELMDVAWKFGFKIMQIDTMPGCVYKEETRMLYKDNFAIARLRKYLSQAKGVVCGIINEQEHAVYWDGGSVYCPSKGIIGNDVLSSMHSVDTFYIVTH